MKKGIFRRLARNGIKNNRKFYLPYILAATGTIMMYFIMSYLSVSSALNPVAGGTQLKMILGLGKFVIAIFGLLFIFYTNSFIIKRRTREFGLYNVLGMSKNNIMKVVGHETLITGFVSIFSGIVLGTILSKAAELVLLKLVGLTARFSFEIIAKPYIETLIIFGAIFFLLLIVQMGRIKLRNPIELLKSESHGEKPPKANIFLAIIGVIVLGVAYYMAVSINDPIGAVTMFFFAVILVIIATYMLFVAGSVVICKVLQKKKSYYYKPNHFVSVSSMSYRMKRNGAGLATICILCTMVLVMISSTASLYVGVKDSVETTYPMDVASRIDIYSTDHMDSKVYTDMVDAIHEAGVGTSDELTYTMAEVYGFREDSNYRFSSPEDIEDYSYAYQFEFVSMDDYKRVSKQVGEGAEDNSDGDKLRALSAEAADLTLEEGEIAVYGANGLALGDTMTIQGREYKVKKQLSGIPFYNGSEYYANTYVVVSNSFKDFADTIGEVTNREGQEYRNSYIYAYCIFNTDYVQSKNYDLEIKLFTSFSEKFDGRFEQDDYFSASVVVKEDLIDDFYGLYGGLFFIGICLSIVFTFATVLIIYYKQLSEGYEDKPRFEIMKKIGMTDGEIKKSINSQVLTVFFAPIVIAGIHLAFAFPMIKTMLTLFGMFNSALFTLMCVGCFAAFAIIYAIIYKKTSGSYFEIVSTKKFD